MADIDSNVTTCQMTQRHCLAHANEMQTWLLQINYGNPRALLRVFRHNFLQLPATLLNRLQVVLALGPRREPQFLTLGQAACRLPVHYVANRSLIHLAPFLLQQVKVALLPNDVLLHGLAIVARLPIDRAFKSPWQAHLKVRRKVGFESLHMNYSPATPRSFATSSNSKVSHTVLATLVKFLSKGTPRFFGSISDSYSQSLTFFSNVASSNPGSLPSHVGGGGSLPPEAAGASPQDPT